MSDKILDATATRFGNVQIEIRGNKLRYLRLTQGGFAILIDPAAIPALIAALQAAASEAEGRGNE
jgi:hypothetical protein